MSSKDVSELIKSNDWPLESSCLGEVWTYSWKLSFQKKFDNSSSDIQKVYWLLDTFEEIEISTQEN